MGIAPKMRCSFVSPLTGACTALKSLIAKSFMDVSSGEWVGNGVSVIVGGTGVRVGILVGMGETVGVHAGVDEAGAGIGVGPVDAPLHPASNEITNIKPAIVRANCLIFMTLDPRE